HRGIEAAEVVQQDARASAVVRDARRAVEQELLITRQPVLGRRRSRHGGGGRAMWLLEPARNLVRASYLLSHQTDPDRMRPGTHARVVRVVAAALLVGLAGRHLVVVTQELVQVLRPRRTGRLMPETALRRIIGVDSPGLTHYYSLTRIIIDTPRRSA